MGWGALAAINPVMAFANMATDVGGAIMQNEWNKRNADHAADRNDASVREQLNFQNEMSSTAHQREVTDLRKAGLNPILSANAGASTPSGGSSTAPMAHAENILSKGVTSALDTLRLAKEMKAVDSQTKLNEAAGTAALAAATRDASTAKNNEANTRLLDATFGASKAKAKTEEGQARQDLQFQNFDNLQRRINNGLSTINNAKDAILGTPKGTFRDLGKALRRNQIIINEKTGEIIRP